MILCLSPFFLDKPQGVPSSQTVACKALQMHSIALIGNVVKIPLAHLRGNVLSFWNGQAAKETTLLKYCLFKIPYCSNAVLPVVCTLHG